MAIIAGNIVVGGGGTVIESSVIPDVPTLESIRQKAVKNTNKPVEKIEKPVVETSVKQDVVQHAKRSSYLLDMVTFNDE
jgi:hypothetical protein